VEVDASAKDGMANKVANKTSPKAQQAAGEKCFQRNISFRSRM